MKVVGVTVIKGDTHRPAGQRAIPEVLQGVGQGFVHLRVDGTPPSLSYLPVGERTMIGLDG